ncbi:hypothetical protein WR25_10808 [Diploscapter pachys]|uniref:Domain of unknown function DX domain-containing protein n=1 Tax=Diploscapter pachys TaxID=2018661 RepID=A0A2A2JBK9_9BILA|nr:hypothetical protein WR25_10808 [Diploscapter pachys]
MHPHRPPESVPWSPGTMFLLLLLLAVSLGPALAIKQTLSTPSSRQPNPNPNTNSSSSSSVTTPPDSQAIPTGTNSSSSSQGGQTTAHEVEGPGCGKDGFVQLIAVPPKDLPTGGCKSDDTACKNWGGECQGNSGACCKDAKQLLCPQTDPSNTGMRLTIPKKDNDSIWQITVCNDETECVDQIGGAVENYVCLEPKGIQQGVANLKICCQVKVEQASCYDQNRPSGTCNSNRDCLAGEEFCMQAINENGKVVTNQHYCCKPPSYEEWNIVVPSTQGYQDKKTDADTKYGLPKCANDMDCERQYFSKGESVCRMFEVNGGKNGLCVPKPFSATGEKILGKKNHYALGMNSDGSGNTTQCDTNWHCEDEGKGVMCDNVAILIKGNVVTSNYSFTKKLCFQNFQCNGAAMTDENKVGPMICKNDGECENEGEKGYCVNLEKSGASEGFCCLCESMMNPDQGSTNDPNHLRLFVDPESLYIYHQSFLYYLNPTTAIIKCKAPKHLGADPNTTNIFGLKPSSVSAELTKGCSAKDAVSLCEQQLPKGLDPEHLIGECRDDPDDLGGYTGVDARYKDLKLCCQYRYIKKPMGPICTSNPFFKYPMGGDKGPRLCSNDSDCGEFQGITYKCNTVKGGKTCCYDEYCPDLYTKISDVTQACNQPDGDTSDGTHRDCKAKFEKTPFICQNKKCCPNAEVKENKTLGTYTEIPEVEYSVCTPKKCSTSNDCRDGMYCGRMNDEDSLTCCHQGSKFVINKGCYRRVISGSSSYVSG